MRGKCAELTGAGRWCCQSGRGSELDGQCEPFGLQDGRAIINEGLLVQSGGSASIQNGATLTNNATMDLRGDGAWANAGGSGVHRMFNNLGPLKKSGGGGSSVFSDVDFNNIGTVTIAQGQIVVNGVALIP